MIWSIVKFGNLEIWAFSKQLSQFAEGKRPFRPLYLVRKDEAYY